MKEISNNIVFLVGMMASGKTTVGKLLANRLSMEFVDMDELIVNEEQMSINEIFESKGEKYFRKIESEVLRSLSSRNNIIISTGGGTPIYHGGLDYMLQQGTVVWLKVAVNEIYQRLKKNKDRPLAKSISKHQLTSLIRARNPIYSRANIRVWNKGDKNAVTDRIIKQL